MAVPLRHLPGRGTASNGRSLVDNQGLIDVYPTTSSSATAQNTGAEATVNPFRSRRMEVPSIATEVGSYALGLMAETAPGG
jgi:hypothetical protein